MQYNRDRKDKDGENTAQYMRDDFAKITDKLKENNKLSRSDYIKLLSGAMIVSNNIDDQIKIQQKVLHNYRSNLIPRFSIPFKRAPNFISILQRIHGFGVLPLLYSLLKYSRISFL